tara:strand:+ start:271 stop:510 length:240 start_codon:yes stop_codon:yes gene_type:complete
MATNDRDLGRGWTATPDGDSWTILKEEYGWGASAAFVAAHGGELMLDEWGAEITLHTETAEWLAGVADELLSDHDDEED